MRIFSLGLCLVGSLIAGQALADNLERRVAVASDVVIDRMTSEQAIPDYVIEHAKCIASIKVVKAGLIWGGAGSTGLVSCRTEEGWSAPSFINVGGVNFGIQIGVQFIESVLVFVTDSGRDILDEASFQIGTNISYAAGPIGEGSGDGQMPDAEVLSYEKTFGLYAGATVEGFILSHGRTRNAQVYGEDVIPRAILNTSGKDAPTLVMPFVETLEMHTP